MEDGVSQATEAHIPGVVKLLVGKCLAKRKELFVSPIIVVEKILKERVGLSHSVFFKLRLVWSMNADDQIAMHGCSQIPRHTSAHTLVSVTGSRLAFQGDVCE